MGSFKFKTFSLQDNGSFSQKTADVVRKSSVSDLHASSWSRCRSWDSSPPGREISNSAKVEDINLVGESRQILLLCEFWIDVRAVAWSTASICSNLETMETMNDQLNDICIRRYSTWKHLSASFFPPGGCRVVPGNLARSLQHIRSTRHPTRAAPQRLQKNLCPFDPNYMKKTSFESMSDKTKSIPFWFS